MGCRMIKVFSLAALAVFASAGASPADEQHTTRAGNRLLGISITEPENKDYNAAFQTARSAGVQVVSLSLAWDDVEKSPDKFESPWPKTANAFYPANKVKVSLRFATFDTNRNRFPGDLRALPIDDKRVIDRFNAFTDWALREMKDVEFSDISIGNEVDVSLGADRERWKQYTTFFKATREHIRSNQPDVRVGSNISFNAYTGTAKSDVAELNRHADVVMVSYYPLTPAFKVRPPSVVRADFDKLCSAYPGMRIHFTETGYPSASVCDSSLALQREFVEQVFAAWDAHADQVKMILFVWMHDLPVEQVERFKGYYGVSDRAFLGYLSSLGLRTYEGNGADKPAFTALKAAVRRQTR